MKFSETITLSEELLTDLPNLEVLCDGTEKWFETKCVTNGTLSFKNIKDRFDEYIINIKDLLPESEMGSVLNLDDYYQSLKNACINQEIIEYQLDKKLTSDASAMYLPEMDGSY